MIFWKLMIRVAFFRIVYFADVQTHPCKVRKKLTYNKCTFPAIPHHRCIFSIGKEWSVFNKLLKITQQSS